MIRGLGSSVCTEQFHTSRLLYSTQMIRGLGSSVCTEQFHTSRLLYSTHMIRGLGSSVCTEQFHRSHLLYSTHMIRGLGSSIGRARDSRSGSPRFDSNCGRPLPTGWVGVSIMLPSETSHSLPALSRVAARKIVRRQSLDPSMI